MSIICLLGLLTACDDSTEDLVGRWELVAINDLRLVEVPPARLGGSQDHDQSWIEEKLVSRTLEIFEEEREFFDRSVVRITWERAVDTTRRPAQAPIPRTEVMDTLLLTGTLEMEGDTIGFRPSPVAGRIQGSRSDDPGTARRGFRGAIRVGPLGPGVEYVLVGTREEDRLRLRGPDGTIFTFERVDGTP